MKWWISIKELEENGPNAPHVCLYATRVSKHWPNQGEPSVQILPCYRTSQIARLPEPCTRVIHKLFLRIHQAGRLWSKVAGKCISLLEAVQLRKNSPHQFYERFQGVRKAWPEYFFPLKRIKATGFCLVFNSIPQNRMVCETNTSKDQNQLSSMLHHC